MISLLKSIRPEEAEGKVKAVYENLEAAMGMVPNVLQFQSASEDVFLRQMDFLKFIMDHETLSAELMAWTRLIISARKNCDYCIRMNAGMLLRRGYTEDEIKQGITNPAEVRLTDKEKAMLHFVLKIMFEPEKIEEADVDALRKMGWSDKEIFEASWAGSKQYGMVQLFKGFKVKLDI